MFKKISLNGHKNVTIQSDKDVNIINLNLGDIRDSLSILSNYITNLDDIEPLYGIIENKKEHNQDWEELSKRIETCRFLKEHFEYTGYIDEFETLKLMRLRRPFYKDSYEVREYDNTLFNFINESKNVLLIGNSLAGKTRMIIQLIERYKSLNKKVFLYIPIEKDYSKGFFKGIQDDSVTEIAILDDIDKYYKSTTGNNLVEELIQNNVIIIGTCKTGPEYNYYKLNSSSEVKDVFNIIDVKKKKLSVDLLHELANKLNIDLQETEYDGNIGSLLLPITKMRERYEMLQNMNDLSGQVSINYLKSIKALNYASNFKLKNLFELSKIEDFCLRLTIGRFAGTNIEAKNKLEEELMKAQKKNQQHIISEFLLIKEKSLLFLESNTTNLNFVVKTNDFIETEDVYLEKIVNYSPFQAYSDINNFYTKEEQRSKGFFAKPDHYNNAIRKSKDIAEAKAHLNKMINQGIKPNQDTYSLLIGLSKSKIELNEWVNKAQKEGLLSVSSYGEILKKANNQEEIVLTLSEFTSNYKYLFDYAKESISWFFHIICYKSINVNIINILKLFISKNLEITLQSLVLATHKITSLEEGKELIQIAFENGIILTEKFFNNLVSKADNFDNAKALIELASEKEVKLSEIFFNNLVLKADNFDNAKALIELASEKEVKLSEEFFNSLVEKADNFDNAKALIELASEKEVKLSEEFFNNLVSKADNFDNAKALIELASEKEVKLSEIFFNNLVSKADNFDNAKALIELASEKEVKLSEIFFNNLVFKADNFDNAKALIELASEKEVKLSEEFFNSLVEKTRSKNEVNQLFILLDSHKITPSIHILNKSLWMIDSLNDSISFLNIQKVFYSVFPELEYFDEIKESTLIGDKKEFLLNLSSSFQKLYINMILIRNFEKNLIDKNSMRLISDLFMKTKYYFYEELRARIEKITAPNTSYNDQSG